MKKHFFLPVLLLISSFLFSACASDSSTDTGTNNNNNPTVPLGTIRVKWDGVLKTYTTVVTLNAAADSAIVVDAQDPEFPNARFRMFIYNPKVGTYNVRMSGDQDVALIQGVKAENGSASGMIAHSGTLKVTKFEGKNIAGTFSFTASADGTTNGTQVQGTEGEFNLQSMN
jgi:hypothetical protein